MVVSEIASILIGLMVGIPLAKFGSNLAIKRRDKLIISQAREKFLEQKNTYRMEIGGKGKLIDVKKEMETGKREVIPEVEIKVKKDPVKKEIKKPKKKENAKVIKKSKKKS